MERGEGARWVLVRAPAQVPSAARLDSAGGGSCARDAYGREARRGYKIPRNAAAEVRQEGALASFERDATLAKPKPKSHLRGCARQHPGQRAQFPVRNARTTNRKKYKSDMRAERSGASTGPPRVLQTRGLRSCCTRGPGDAERTAAWCRALGWVVS